MKKAILISILIGLLLSVGASYLAIGQETIPRDSLTFGLCTGLTPPQDVTVRNKIGIPLQVTDDTHQKVDTCSDGYIVPFSKTAQFRSYLKSWQFYVNWLLWTLPWLGLVYVWQRRRARLRAHA